MNVMQKSGSGCHPERSRRVVLVKGFGYAQPDIVRYEDSTRKQLRN